MKKILILEDDDRYINQLEDLFEDKYEVLIAENINQAKEIAPDIDLALVDIRLKADDDNNRDGLVFLEWIVANFNDIPVFMMSGFQEFEYGVDALNLGAKYFFKKPLDENKLLEKIEEFIKGN